MKFRVFEAPPREMPEPGEVLVDRGLAQEALPYLVKNCLERHSARDWNNLGKARKHLGELAKAEDAFERSIELDPSNPFPTYNLGLVLEDLGRFEEAEQCYENALGQSQRLIARHPSFLQGQEQRIYYALACSYMRRGEFDKAWPFWRIPRGMTPRVTSIPVWHGEDLEDKKILVLREGGYGDEILYLRYLAKLKVLGAKVTYLGSKSMKGLLSEHPWIDQWLDERDEIESEAFDYQVSLWSIMDVLNLPLLGMGEVPYLRAGYYDWGEPRPTVGICWRPAEDPNVFRKFRAIQRELLEDVADLPFRWVSLQYGEKAPPWMQDVNHLMEGGWHETARLVAALDMVVSTDTALVHLAGGLGIQALLVLPLNVDWKWQAAGEKTAWYPSVHLVRNTEPISFAPAVKEVKRLLQERFAGVMA
jgi:hypothetical protein